MSVYDQMNRDDLLRALHMFAANWLAHDGCWFLAAEEQLGMDAAIELDRRSWERFAATEARRIMITFGLPANGGLDVLARALQLRMYALINDHHIEWTDDHRILRFTMDRCRVQETRRQRGLPDFPCKSVGMIEFSTFARTIDPRICARCGHCPPDALEGKYCSWEFEVEELAKTGDA